MMSKIDSDNHTREVEPFPAISSSFKARDRPTPLARPKPLQRQNPSTFPIRGYLRLSMPISHSPRAIHVESAPLFCPTICHH
jgi:hypothetical protein